MPSFILSISDSNDVGPKYLSLEVFLLSLRKRPCGRANNRLVPRLGEGMVDSWTVDSGRIDYDLTEADETVEEESKCRFREA